MIDNARIGRAIRTLREKAGYTQKELAEQLFVSPMAVSKWERGKSMPDPSMLQRLAAILDMDVDGILDGTASYLDDRWHGALLLYGMISSDSLLWDKPLIDYQISYFLLAGVRNILIACGERDADYINRRFSGGEALGVRLRFAGLDGLTVEAALGGGKGADIMLITEPFFLYGVDLSRFMQRAMQHKSAVVNLASVVGSDGEQLREGYSQYLYQSVPIYFLQANTLKAYQQGDALCSVVRQAEQKKRLRAEPMDKGFVLSALQSAKDTETVSALVRSIQELGRYLIYCPPEIAWRRGMISREQMKEEAARMPEYQAYLESLF